VCVRSTFAIGSFAKRNSLGKLRALLDHGHIRSEPSYRLREFKTYIAPANHYEMTWQTIESERLDMGHRSRRGESGNVGIVECEPRSRNTRSPTIECRHR
jgi:hypothetical protein